MSDLGVEREAAPVVVVPLGEFIASDEEAPEALIGTEEENVLPAGGDMIVFGGGGDGKSTLVTDQMAHLGAGIPWLGFPVHRPVRILLLENEGPRPQLRRKLRRKVETWTGPPFTQNVQVWESPWGRFSFADDRLCDELAKVIDREQVDLLIAGPIRRLGLEGGGTPEQVVAYGQLVANLRGRLNRPLAVESLHHTNKGGSVSGAFGPEPDTLLRVRHSDVERTTIEWEKTRWSSATHGRRMTLAWVVGCEGFAIVDSDVPSARPDAATYEQRIVDWLALHPWATTDALDQGVEGRGTEVRAARKRLLGNGQIVRKPSAELGHPGKGMRWNLSNQAAPSPVPDPRTPRDTAPPQTEVRPAVPPLGGRGERTDGDTATPDTSEPTLDAALQDPDLLHRFVTPYAELVP